MLADTGTILIALGLSTAGYAVGAVLRAIRTGDRRWWESGRRGIVISAAALGLAVLLLLAAFLDDDFSIRYVAQHSSRDLPIYLKASAVWGGQAGSLLLWAALQALFGAIAVSKSSRETRDLMPWAAVFLSLVTVFFTAITLFLSNPFMASRVSPADGQGLNPLLRHPGMVFHPPAMYLGYVGLAVPFALGLAALATGKLDGWATEARRWPLVAWLFLGLGLLLGMRWAYDVLGWGGYWGWDPVENAGLMPWLTATGLLHALVMQEQGRGFRWWSMILSVLSFVLVLFGTFTTRSGLIQSVHAFARSPLGPYFLAAIAAALIGSLGLLYSRRKLLTTATPSDDLLSREGAFVLTLIILLTLTGSVLIGTILPTITRALMAQSFEAGPAWFDRVTGPQFAALVFIMGICPLLGRAVGSIRRLRQHGLPTLVGGLVVPTAAALSGFSRPLPLIGFGIAGLAGGTALGETVRGIARERQRRGSTASAVSHVLRRRRRQYGVHLIHVGVILMAIGVIGTRFFPSETQAVLAAGESVHIGDYTVELRGLERDTLGQVETTHASLTVYRGGGYLGTMRPRVDEYAARQETIAAPAVRAGLWEDLYIVLAGWTEGGARTTLKIFVNPLASFLWLGGLVLTAGGALGLWSAAQAGTAPMPEAQRRRAGRSIGIVALLALVGLAAWAMWGRSEPVPAPARRANQDTLLTGGLAGRPRVGEPAPDVHLELLDGSTLSISDMDDQVVVLSFWSPDCQPCRDQLPGLQAVWQEYQTRDVVIVGISLPSLAAGVAEVAGASGITYPLALDGAAPAQYGITGVPETFVIEPGGHVAHFHIGAVTADTLREELDALLSE